MKQSDRTFDYFNQHLDKILFGIGLIYLIGVSGLLKSQNRLVGSWGTQVQTAAPTTKAPLSNEDTKFIAYLQQSLKIVSQQNSSAKNNSQTASNVPPSAPSNILPLSLQSSKNQSSPTNPTVIERIYVPVYPPQASQTNPYVSPPQTSAAIPSPTVPLLPIPAKLVLQKPNIAPLITRTTPYNLVGVLDFGDRSSALFTENELTQRIELGEKIGSSGWTLTGVENQRAILSRPGKTRYLEVGQSF